MFQNDHKMKAHDRKLTQREVQNDAKIVPNKHKIISQCFHLKLMLRYSRKFPTHFKIIGKLAQDHTNFSVLLLNIMR